MAIVMDSREQAEALPDVSPCAYTGRHIHLIGIGGCGMRALAAVLLARGAVVSGSDQFEGGAVQRLAAMGATVYLGQQGDNIPPRADTVVCSAAIAEQNPELLAARARAERPGSDGRRLEVLKYSQMLGRLMAEGTGVAVAGTHGKSTTSGMVAWALKAAGADPSFIIGATVAQLGGPSGAGGGKHFVAEACEFDRSFLNLQPHYAAILNIEEDHLDCYRDLAEIHEAFRAFASRVNPAGALVANGESREVVETARFATCPVETFGLAEGCTWRGVGVTCEKGCYGLDVQFDGRAVCRLSVPLPGLHNAYNALAATALLVHAGLEAPQAAELLGQFAGTHRRMTLKGTPGGVTVLDDYAHHPTEIQVTLRAIRDRYQPRRLICIFQPHQHSRTRFLLKDFARSFGQADEVIVPDIYFVRDSELEKDYISAQDLVSQIRLNGGAAMHLQKFEDIAQYVQDALSPKDLVVTMGAGNIWEVADEIVRRIGSDR